VKYRDLVRQDSALSALLINMKYRSLESEINEQIELLSFDLRFPVPSTCLPEYLVRANCESSNTYRSRKGGSKHRPGPPIESTGS